MFGVILLTLLWIWFAGLFIAWLSNWPGECCVLWPLEVWRRWQDRKGR